MATTYTFCGDLNAPTIVERCVRARFTSTDHVNVILAKTSVLEVYQLKLRKYADPEGVPRRVLTRCGEYKLFGNIEDMAVINTPGNVRDSLLLTFKDAKMSLVEFDPAINDIVTTSMHYWDHKRYEIARQLKTTSAPEVRVDPLNRCVVMFIYATRLLVFPIRNAKSSTGREAVVVKKESGESLISSYPEAQNQTLLEPFSIDTSSIGVREVKDLLFLEGFAEPSLLILHENQYTWPGRYAVAEHTCGLRVLSLNLAQRTHSVIETATVDRLPHTSHTLIPLSPSSGGGALVACADMIYHYNNHNVGYGLSVNEFGDRMTKTATFVGQSADVRQIEGKLPFTFLTPRRLLLCLEDGELFLLELFPQGQSMNRMELSRVGVASRAADLCSPTPNHVFLASRLGHSLLIHFREQTSEEISEQEQEEIRVERLKAAQQKAKDDEYKQFRENLKQQAEELKKEQQEREAEALKALGEGNGGEANEDTSGDEPDKPDKPDKGGSKVSSSGPFC